ncbi:Mcm2-7 hexameric complex component, partial [Conglomerata obtusa]
MSFDLKPFQAHINFPSDTQKISSFLLFYPTLEAPKYIKKEKTIKIFLSDLFLYDESLYHNVIKNAPSYLEIFYKVYDKIFYDDREIMYDGENVMMYHRLARLKEKMPDLKVTDVFPGELLRDYEIFFVIDESIIKKCINESLTQIQESESINQDIMQNNSNNNSTYIKNDSYLNKTQENSIKTGRFSFFSKIRDLDADKIGNYVLVRGMVTKITQITPTIQLASYICESCASETYQPIRKENFNLILQCNSQKCKIQKIKPTLVLRNRASKFTTFQSVTLTENTSDIPKGCIPKNIKLYFFGSLCGSMKPGDSVYASGMFMPKKIYGLLHETYITVHEWYSERKINLEEKENCDQCIEEENKRNKYDKELFKNEHELDNDNNTIANKDFKLNLINTSTNSCLRHNNTFTPENILKSIAPEIYGLENIKKILLLALIGAPKKEEHFMKIRGNINILLVGDPGTAKSQLLKTIMNLAPRGVFTTGKGSSGVGLTASVTRDPITHEMILEGGALVLSDNGVCCIDELDKMNENDRVSIHEVMEQQSISINKAGINTSLNARCSIIGAANPIKGCFKPEKSLEWNLGLPVALLSRFDCVCVIKDEIDLEKDKALANHITSNFIDHNNQETNYDDIKNIADSVFDNNLITYDKIRKYIEYTKTFKPVLSTSLGKVLVDAFVEQRKNFKNTTPRYLLSLIRFTLSHARLRLSKEVERIDVDEAIRLMEQNIFESQIKSVEYESIERIIYEAIKKNINSNNEILYEEILEICKNYGKENIDRILNSYMDAGALIIENSIIKLT